VEYAIKDTHYMLSVKMGAFLKHALEMEHLSSDMEQQEQQVQWRRDKVQEICSKEEE
jgi:hypothetical protein